MMTIVRRPSMRLAVAVGAVALWFGAGAAHADDAGLVFRANGWYKGKEDISDGQIKCEIPSTSTAIADGAFSIGIWNTYGVETLFYPDRNNPFGNPCGGWLQLQNNSLFEGMNLDRVKLKFRVRGARRWRELVPTRGGFPVACAAMRRSAIFSGARLDPFGGPPHSSGGAPNVAFVQALPIVRPELIHCLRSQYNVLDTDVFVDLPLVVEATAYATSDSGKTYRSNPVRYTLNMRHTCGNGRADDGEECDPGDSLTSQCFGGSCKNNECSLAPGVACVDNADCIGGCYPRGNVQECTCYF